MMELTLEALHQHSLLGKEAEAAELLGIPEGVMQILAIAIMIKARCETWRDIKPVKQGKINQYTGEPMRGPVTGRHDAAKGFEPPELLIRSIFDPRFRRILITLIGIEIGRRQRQQIPVIRRGLHRPRQDAKPEKTKDTQTSGQPHHYHPVHPRIIRNAGDCMPNRQAVQYPAPSDFSFLPQYMVDLRHAQTQFPVWRCSAVFRFAGSATGSLRPPVARV
jgi:hypothetical protein